MKIIYDGESLDRKKPSSFGEDANNVYVAGVLVTMAVAVPVGTVAISAIALPALGVGLAVRSGINAVKGKK